MVTASTIRELATADAPGSIEPYSQGVVSSGKLYASGQGSVDPETGEIVDGTPTEQTVRTLENVGAILKAGGSSLTDVVKATVFLKGMRYYDEVNEVYGKYMPTPYPTRNAVEAVKLPVDINVKIEVVTER